MVKNIEKNKVYGIIIGIIAFILLLVGATYAWFSWNSNSEQRTNVKLTVTKDIGNAIIYNAGESILSTADRTLEPSETYTDGISTTIELWKKEKVTTTIYGQISMEILSMLSSTDTNDANISKSKTIKWAVTTYNINNSTEVLLSEGNFLGKKTGNKFTITQDFELNNFQTFYKVYLWFDTNAIDVNHLVSGELLSTEISVSATDTIGEYGINPPKLVNGLIPVYYNESTSKWVKADSNNTSNSWYDYSQKKWANAVLVKENSYAQATGETNKSVSISNQPSGAYTSSNKGVNSSSSVSVFTFTTGTNGGTFSFDYTVSSETNYDKLTVTLNDSTIINAISGTKSSTYSTTLTANTTYTMTATYLKDSSAASGDDQATISNIVLPSGLASNLTVTASGDYGWTQGYSYSMPTYSSYKLTDAGSYVLATSNNISATEAIGKYICSDTTSTECSEIYQIKEASGDNITKVDTYTISTKTGVRTGYINASIGTEITENDILAFYVWIPRYKYKVWNINKVVGTDSYDAYNKGIDIKFENGTSSTGTISCNYDFTVTEGNGLSETCTGSNGDYYTHPAFTFGDNELTGFWIGKFEISSSDPSATNGGGNTTSLTTKIIPNVVSWRSNPVSKFWKVIYDMQASSNIYGLPTDRTNVDSHMLTNMEWGAVAYLTNSKYGRCTDGTCTEVELNSNSNFTTGCGPQSQGSKSSGSTCNAYNTTLGMLASTTGNIYGVYDMSGGSFEYVMGNMSSASGSYTYYPSSAGTNYTYTGNEKYVTTYSYGTTYTDQQAYNRARLGDATGEVMLSARIYGAWYSDLSLFPFSSHPWFARGGHYNSGSNAGLFGFYRNYGSSYSDSSARAALAGFAS